MLRNPNLYMEIEAFEKMLRYPDKNLDIEAYGYRNIKLHDSITGTPETGLLL